MTDSSDSSPITNSAPDLVGGDSKWALSARVFVSGIIVVSLSIVLLGPLSNPVGSDSLTLPLARMVAPVHQVLFLGHGYRFFGPDPGPSHLVYYEITNPDDSLVEGHFPDRDFHSPRLIYHRWFMLSETLYDEFRGKAQREPIYNNLQEMAKEIDRLRLQGQAEVANQLKTEKELIKSQFENGTVRIDNLVRAIAKRLLANSTSQGAAIPDGTRIKLTMKERLIPFPNDISMGKHLSDSEYLVELFPIGTFVMNQGQLVEVQESELPSKDSAMDIIMGAGEGARE